MLRFVISRWHAWAPGLHQLDRWESWARAPYCPYGHYDAPKVDFLPLMQRRRLSTMARMAFASAWSLVEDEPPMPVVFASRHGETTRGFDLLYALAGNEPLSPTSFGLSVHNAIPGQWSIARQEMLESVALSVEGAAAEHAFAEACGLLANGYERALVILAEEAPPHAFRQWTTDVPFPYATAFVVAAGDHMHLHLDPNDALAGDEAGLPSALTLLRHLLLGSPRWHFRTDRHSWIWTRQK